jgi:hypothetical protein
VSSPFDLSTVTHPWRVTIKNNHGEELVGLLHDTGSKDLVILCHGFQSWKVIFPDKQMYPSNVCSIFWVKFWGGSI